MMIVLSAAALAAQPAPPANAPAQQMPMQHEQHEGMKKDCCCKDLADKHAGHAAEQADHGSH